MPTANRTVKISDPAGLHARPASQLVKLVSASGATVTISKTPGQPGVNAGSILGVLSLGIAQGNDVEIIVDGDEADRIADEVAYLLEHQEG